MGHDVTETPSITCPLCGRTSYNQGDVEHRYCSHCSWFHDDPPPAPPAALSSRIELALTALDLPPVLPGEQLPEGVRVMLLEAPDVSLSSGPRFYGMNGEPLEGSDASMMERVNTLRGSEAAEIHETVVSGQGEVSVEISTAYMGLDLSPSGPAPLIWETFVVIGVGTASIVPGPWRYATKAAASAGHTAIAATVRMVVGE